MSLSAPLESQCFTRWVLSKSELAHGVSERMNVTGSMWWSPVFSLGPYVMQAHLLSSMPHSLWLQVCMTFRAVASLHTQVALTVIGPFLGQAVMARGRRE